MAFAPMYIGRSIRVQMEVRIMVDIVRRDRSRGGLLNRWQDEFTDLFTRVFEELPVPGTRVTGWWPTLDVVERDDAIEVRAELPGMKAEDIDIGVQGNTLTLSGEKKEEQERREGENYYHVERRYGMFRRELTLPAGVDATKVDASYKDGILTIQLPKTEQAKPRKIHPKSE